MSKHAMDPTSPRKRARDYDIGYRKPPRGKPFQPGESGNPKGRPKKRKSLNEVVQEALDRKVLVELAGKSKRIPKREVGAERIANGVARGDIQMLRLARELEAAARTNQAQVDAARAEDIDPDGPLSTVEYEAFSLACDYMMWKLTGEPQDWNYGRRFGHD